MSDKKRSLVDQNANILAGSLRVEPITKASVVAATRLREAPRYVPAAASPFEDRHLRPPEPERLRLVWEPDAPTTEKVPVETIRRWNFERAIKAQQEQQSLTDALKAAKKLARKEGRCDFEVAALKARKAEGHNRWVCDTFAVRRGLCRKHYNLKYLYVQPAVPGSGRGKTRPFAGWQLHGSMTDKQHERLRELPLAMAYEDCIAEMNATDPSNILPLIYEKLGSRKSTA